MKLLPYILSLFVASVVSAQTIVVHTNNFFDLNPSRDAFTAATGSTRIRLTVTDGVGQYDVSAGLPIKLRVISRIDGFTNSIINTITNDGTGVIWWAIPALSASEYHLKSDIVLPGDTFPIYDRYLTVTSAPAASAATVNLSVTNEITVNATSQVSVTSIQTNNITVNTYVTNVTQSTVYTSGVSSISLTGAVDGAITFAGSGVTQTGSVFNFSGGGGSGNITIEGVTTNVFDFVGQFPVTVSNIGNTIYFGQLGGGGTFIPAGTSNQVFNFVSATNQSFTVPAGVTQIYAYAWGAGGGGGTQSAGGAGGYSFGYFSVTNAEVLIVHIGQGGFTSLTSASHSATANAYPNGGAGAQTLGSIVGGGGGSTAILRGTNYLLIAGGGGGAANATQVSGIGGGISGSDGAAASGGTLGGGGTQSAGGTTGSTAIPLAFTNTAGSLYLGGNAGVTTNLTAKGSGGGGGGWYGGGGGLSITGSGGSGGGGSGYVNLSQGVQGTTVRGGITAAATATDDPLYGSPSSATWGRGGAVSTAGSNGGLILRWVAP